MISFQKSHKNHSPSKEQKSPFFYLIKPFSDELSAVSLSLSLSLLLFLLTEP